VSELRPKFDENGFILSAAVSAGKATIDPAYDVPALAKYVRHSVVMKLMKLIYDRQSVCQSVLVSGAHLGPATNFSFSLKFLSDICRFLIL
jgi:hypothetical protein